MYLNYKDKIQDYWILDLEANGFDPDTIWCVVCKNLGSEEVLEFLNKEDFNAWYKPTYIIVGHHVLAYDVPVLNRLWDSKIPLSSCLDTLVLSYLYSPALEDGHSLEAWGKRLKFPKTDWNEWDKFSPQMLEYCRNDVELTFRLYKALTERMRGIGFSELSCEIEHKIKTIIEKQIKNGVYFERERAEDFCNFLRGEQARLSEDIHKLFPSRRTKVAEYSFRRTQDGRPFASYEKHKDKYPDLVHVSKPDGSEWYECFELIPFNLRSAKQRIERLLELGWEPFTFTPKGNPKVDEDALVAFAEASGRPEIRALAEWLVVTARLTMLAGNPETKSTGWLGTVQEDHRIHGKVFSCGAASRRMSHNSPNSANVPSAKKAKYGKEFRSFWSVEPNKGLCMIGYDAKGLETECFKHWLNSPEANRVLDGDIHTDNAKILSELIGREIDREWGAKTSWYAWMFGCYPPKLALILKCSIAHATQIFEEVYPNRIPGLKKLLDSVQYEWRTNKGRIECIDGGFVLCPSLNASLNYKIQPTGAVVMKMASILLKEQTEEKGIWNRKLLDVHDEGQHEALEKETYFIKSKNKKGEEIDLLRHPFGETAVESIREAGRVLKFNVPLDGDYAVGYSWAETH